MLDAAPPGSREDLVEAATTPCTPSEFDTMLYGYTNSIYVLDHTPESMPDMDMLQLFASPAGRALIGATREQQQQRANRGSTSTSSLSREAASNTSRGSTSSAASSSNSACTGTISKPAKARTRRSTSSTAALAGKKHCRRLPLSAPSSPQQRRSSADLYQEAVEMLGLTCTLSDSCRCLDCQSSYFDYEEECDCETRPELAAGTPVLLDHALTHPMACSIQ